MRLLNNFYSSIRGQIFSMDALLTLMIVIFYLATYLSIWNSNVITMLFEKDHTDLEYKAIYLSETLINFPGYPKNWELLDNDTVERAGISKRLNVVSAEKVMRLKQFSVAQQRGYLAAPFNFNCSIRNATGDVILYEGQALRFGENMNVTPKNVVIYRSPIVLVNESQILTEGYILTAVWK